MTKALVTGATGFIGRFLVSHLLEQHISVRVLVRHYQKDNFPANVEQHIGDLTNPESLKGIGQDIDMVFHLGGYAHAWHGDSAEQHKQVNLFGTQNIVDECIRDHVKKFIFFSTIKAVQDANHCIDEKWDVLPDSPYGKAKRSAEELVLTKCREHDIHVCVLRLSLVYGPALKGNLYQMLRAIDKKYFLPIPPVDNHRSLVSIDDVCQAAMLAAQCDQANGKIYFVTEEKSYSTYHIYSLMREALGYSTPSWYLPLWLFKVLASVGDVGSRLIRRRLPFNSEAFEKLFGNSHYSATRIHRELGFNSQFSLRDLLPQIVQSYREKKA